ncbi:vesicular glutamate transporter 2.2 [Tetranychus urticae]|uniref:Major facilitator superfamily (MFS) profile domain-containing protein n=1 Tax=Tetranychus urticae TaxID=32264 RepID=T1K4Z5_TETUR|nr:vesicular glutamate transporter 2.2 [Tetranychus urticae]
MSGSRRSLPRHSIASIKSAIQNVARFRWLIFFTGQFANFANNLVGSSLSLTIVAMIEKDKIINTTLDSNNSTIVMKPTSGKIHVDWSHVDKDHMLQAAFWGTLVMSLFGGRICELFGPRKVVSLALATTGSVNLLFPVISIHSFYGAYFVRVVQGLCAGLIQPSTYVVVSRWSTAYERTLSNGVVSSGGSLGNLISLPLSGLLVSSSLFGGWPAVFYIFGGFNLVMAVVWFIIIYDTPEEHPYLGEEELEEILTRRLLKSGAPAKISWGKIFTSIPVYAYLLPAFTYSWVVAIVINQIPSFYEEILGFSHEANGFVASLPWIVSMFSALVGSTIADKIRRKNIVSLSLIRKSFTAVGLGCVSLGLVAITLLKDKRIAVVLTLGVCKGLGTLSTAGYAANHLDIAPSFAGTLAGFAGAIASIASLAANEGAALIVGNKPTQKNWYKLFYISSAINFCGVVFYCIFGSGETQSWDPSCVRRQSVKSIMSNKSRKFSMKSINDDNNNHQNEPQQVQADQQNHPHGSVHHVTISTDETVEFQ